MVTEGCLWGCVVHFLLRCQKQCIGTGRHAAAELRWWAPSAECSAWWAEHRMLPCCRHCCCRELDSHGDQQENVACGQWCYCSYRYCLCQLKLSKKGLFYFKTYIAACRIVTENFVVPWVLVSGWSWFSPQCSGDTETDIKWTRKILVISAKFNTYLHGDRRLAVSRGHDWGVYEVLHHVTSGQSL